MAGQRPSGYRELQWKTAQYTGCPGDRPPKGETKVSAEVFFLKQLLTTHKHHVQQTNTQSALRTLRASLMLLRYRETWPGEHKLPGMTTCASLLAAKSLSQVY